MTTGAAWSQALRYATRVSTASTGAVAVASFSGVGDNYGYASTARTADCESKPKLQRRISSVGNLSLLAETKEHPANQTLLVALVGKPFHKDDFEKLWKNHDMSSRHPRFHQKVKVVKKAAATDNNDGAKVEVKSTGVFEPTQLPLASHVEERPFPTIFNLDLQKKLKSFLQVPLTVENLLWQVQISGGGKLGQSGAIPLDRAAELTVDSVNGNIPPPTESLLIFRGHHALADGISLAAAFTDLCDEAAELKEEFDNEMQEKVRKGKALSWWQKLTNFLNALYYYSIGSFQAFWHYWKLYLATPENPFQQMEDTATHGERSISWARVATVDEVEHVAKSLTKNKQVGLNDVMISCVTAAVARQMQEHQMQSEIVRDHRDKKQQVIKIPKSINAMIPVHSDGGSVLKKGQTVGHRLGAFFAAVPSDVTTIASQRLEHVHASLDEVQQGPALFWSRMGTQVISSLLPVSWATSILQRFQPNAAFLITHSRGPSRRIHFGGREVEVSQCFTPLPAGIPIGVVVSSYAGELSISVTAEPWAVPDADKFVTWVLEEYKFLYTESPVAL